MDNLITIGQYIQVEIIENVFYLINVLYTPTEQGIPGYATILT